MLMSNKTSAPVLGCFFPRENNATIVSNGTSMQSGQTAKRPFKFRREDEFAHGSKTKLLADHIALKIDEGAEPFQTVKQLFRFRDQIAHPKPKEMEEEFETINEELESVFFTKIRNLMKKNFTRRRMLNCALNTSS
jgi:hypothetical protein